MKVELEAAFFRRIFLFQDLEDLEIEQALDRTQPPGISPPAAVIIQEGEPGRLHVHHGERRSGDHQAASPWCWTKTPRRSG